jgi:DnaJ-class molecular chaperone
VERAILKGATYVTEDSTGKREDSSTTGGAPGMQPRETCQMCQGTGRMAFVLPNLLHEEITCPSCDAGKRQVRQISTQPTKETYDR